MKKITITNLKGGVGKTTTAINLAERFAANGYKVLLLDTDHQANMSRFYKVESEDDIHKLFTRGVPVRPQKISDNLHLIPSNSHTATINFELMNNLDWQMALKEVLKKDIYDNYYDYCIIDCPPALDMIVANSLVAADYVLIPLTTGQFAFDGLSSILGRIDKIRQSYNPDLKILGILITMVSERTRAAKAVATHLKEGGLDIKTCQTKIRQCEAFKQAELAHRSIFSFDPKSNGAVDMEQLYQEIIVNIKYPAL